MSKEPSTGSKVDDQCDWSAIIPSVRPPIRSLRPSCALYISTSLIQTLTRGTSPVTRIRKAFQSSALQTAWTPFACTGVLTLIISPKRLPVPPAPPPSTSIWYADPPSDERKNIPPFVPQSGFASRDSSKFLYFLSVISNPP